MENRKTITDLFYDPTWFKIVRRNMNLKVEYLDGKIDEFECESWSCDPETTIDVVKTDHTEIFIPIRNVRKYWMEKVNA